MNIIVSLISFLLFAAFLAFIIYFGVIFITIIFIGIGLLWLYMVMRGYWLSFRYGRDQVKPPEKTEVKKDTTTIIDVEHHDISPDNDKKPQ